MTLPISCPYPAGDPTLYSDPNLKNSLSNYNTYLNINFRFDWQKGLSALLSYTES